MTAATDEAWIQNSLARLEQLEAQRGQLAATGQTDKLAELDEEIRSLYEVLESVAGDEPAAPANAAAPMAAAPMAAPGMAQPMAQPGMQQPMAQPGMQQPMAQPGMQQPMAQPGMQQPMAQPGMQQPMAQPGMEFSGGDDLDDIKPPRSPVPFILAGVLVIGGGVAAALAMGGKSEEPKAEPTGPTTVIKAGAVVEDTQEPVVAKGADADRTQGTNFKESSNNNNSGASSTPRRSNNGSRRSNRSGKGKKEDGRKVTFGDSKDPLGGVN